MQIYQQKGEAQKSDSHFKPKDWIQFCNLGMNQAAIYLINPLWFMKIAYTILMCR